MRREREPKGWRPIPSQAALAVGTREKQDFGNAPAREHDPNQIVIAWKPSNFPWPLTRHCIEFYDAVPIVWRRSFKRDSNGVVDAATGSGL